ncbi:putative tricarboxylate transport protein [Blattella germanica]|nr:putative tricarboxylate transport protein [Blattella germanica]
MEYVKTQLQLDEKSGTSSKQYTGIADCVKKTVQRHGVLGLYRGLSVLLYGSIPKSAVRFGAFESFKGFVVGDNGTLGPVDRMLCGLGAGICEAIFVVTPMETVKVKFINDRRAEKPRFKGFVHGCSLIVKDEGFGGLYKGVTPTILRQGSNQAIRFFVMETLKNWYRGGDPKANVPTIVTGAFGAFAGACSVFGNTPIDVVKTRMQSDLSDLSDFETIVMVMQFLIRVQLLVTVIVMKMIHQRKLLHKQRGDAQAYNDTVKIPRTIPQFPPSILEITTPEELYIFFALTMLMARGLEAKKYKNTLDCAMQVLQRNRTSTQPTCDNGQSINFFAPEQIFM